MRDAEFHDPRLAAIYDAECAWAQDDDYFVALVNETGTARVLDVGCGTGRLALGLAAHGHAVTGLDPAGACLARARLKPGADRITWIQGTVRSAPSAAFDVALMTSHVAQCFVTDNDWATTLVELRRALVKGGRLAFDTRDPQARPWERWNPTDSRRQINLPDGRVVSVSTEVPAIGSGTVTITRSYCFPAPRARRCGRRRVSAPISEDGAPATSRRASPAHDPRHAYFESHEMRLRHPGEPKHPGPWSLERGR